MAPGKKTRTPAKAVARRKTKPTVATLESSVRSLQRRLRQLAAAEAALREKHERQLAAAKRAADRQLAAMMREITTLRHHEARAGALERMVAERDATIAALRAGGEPMPAPSPTRDRAVGESA